MTYLDMCSVFCAARLMTRANSVVEMRGYPVLGIIMLCESGQAELVSSDALDYETERNPHPTRKAYARELFWKCVPLCSRPPGRRTHARR